MRTFFRNENGDASALIGLATSIVAIVVIVVLFVGKRTPIFYRVETITPLIGSEVNESINIPANSAWNSTENANLDDSAAIWEGSVENYLSPENGEWTHTGCSYGSNSHDDSWRKKRYEPSLIRLRNLPIFTCDETLKVTHRQL